MSTALLALLAPLGSAQAQRAFDVERFSPAPDGDGFLSMPGTRTPGPGRWNVALWLGYAQSPLSARLADGRQTPLVSERFGGDLLFQIGLGGRFALVLDAPLVLYQAGSPSTVDGGPALPTTVMGDPRLSLRARLLGEDATEERDRHEGEGLALQVGTTLPIGATDAFAGEGAAQLEAKLLGDFHLLDFGVGGTLGYRHRFAEPQVLGVRFRDELTLGLAVQVPLMVVERAYALAEVGAVTDAARPFGLASSTAVEWLLGVRARVQDVELTLAGGTGLTDGVGTSAYRFVLGVSIAPRVHDRDHDGIEDGRDGCPTLPEDMDRHLDDDGCPEPDNDGDLVPDLDDRCPDEAAVLGRDLDDDGCNDPGSAPAVPLEAPSETPAPSEVPAESPASSDSPAPSEVPAELPASSDAPAPAEVPGELPASSDASTEPPAAASAG